MSHCMCVCVYARARVCKCRFCVYVVHMHVCVCVCVCTRERKYTKEEKPQSLSIDTNILIQSTQINTSLANVITSLAKLTLNFKNVCFPPLPLCVSIPKILPTTCNGLF